MKVYLVYYDIPYEGSSNCACFDSLEKAKTYIDESSKVSNNRYMFGEFGIEEMEVK